MEQQSDIISDCFASLISPFVEPKGKVVHGGCLLFRKLVTGFLAAAYVCLVLTTVMLVSVIFGVGLVDKFAEGPLYLRQRLQFDYTNVHPTAVFDFGGGEFGKQLKSSGARVPVGHTFYARLVMVMPDSDYNIETGMFQVIAELVSGNGDVIATSSHPCMLRFRSYPIRMAQTFIMGIPLTLGITSETQKLSLTILKHKEQLHPRSQYVRLYLAPRVGSAFLPQLYEAELIVNSEPPWMKRMVWNWKWTFCVWTSIYIYLMLLVVSLCCFRPIIFPTMRMSFSDRGVIGDDVIEGKLEGTNAGDTEILEGLKGWKRERNKRKAMFMRGDVLETMEDSTASSITVNREDISMASFEEVGDSDSVCQ